MATIKVNNTDIYYELHGQGEPLVLIAGYTCDHLFWLAILEDLKQYFQVLIFDNRGVGQTQHRGNSFTLEEMADDTIALIEKIGLTRPHIVGHSMGGAIAQIVARKCRAKLGKLIIMNSAAKFNARTLFAVESLIVLRKENTSLDSLIDAGLPWFFSSNFLADKNNVVRFKEVIKNNPYPQSIENQLHQFKAILTFDSRSWLKEITALTLVIASEDDIVDLISESEELIANIKNAELSIIPGGHSSPIEQPKIIAKLIVDFICEVFRA
jgi:3-oxoadipate enol-lactonase